MHTAFKCTVQFLNLTWQAPNEENKKRVEGGRGDSFHFSSLNRCGCKLFLQFLEVESDARECNNLKGVT